MGFFGVIDRRVDFSFFLLDRGCWFSLLDRGCGGLTFSTGASLGLFSGCRGVMIFIEMFWFLFWIWDIFNGFYCWKAIFGSLTSMTDLFLLSTGTDLKETLYPTSLSAFLGLSLDWTKGLVLIIAESFTVCLLLVGVGGWLMVLCVIELFRLMSLNMLPLTIAWGCVRTTILYFNSLWVIWLTSCPSIWWLISLLP